MKFILFYFLASFSSFAQFEVFLSDQFKDFSISNVEKGKYGEKIIKPEMYNKKIIGLPSQVHFEIIMKDSQKVDIHRRKLVVKHFERENSPISSIGTKDVDLKSGIGHHELLKFDKKGNLHRLTQCESSKDSERKMIYHCSIVNKRICSHLNNESELKNVILEINDFAVNDSKEINTLDLMRYSKKSYVYNFINFNLNDLIGANDRSQMNWNSTYWEIKRNGEISNQSLKKMKKLCQRANFSSEKVNKKFINIKDEKNNRVKGI